MPPIIAITSVITHGRFADADMVRVKRLEPKLLHAVMIMLMVTTSAADAAAINMMLTFLVLVMLNAMVMRMLMHGDNNGNDVADAAGTNMMLTFRVLIMLIAIW